jgi:hypothetical protein
MSLTPDQIRLRLEQANDRARGNMATEGAPDVALEAVIDVLREVLPEIVAELREKPAEGSQDTPYRSQERESRQFQGWCHLCRVVIPVGLSHYSTQSHMNRAAGEDGIPENACPDCTPEQPCERARALVGEDT